CIVQLRPEEREQCIAAARHAFRRQREIRQQGQPLGLPRETAQQRLGFGVVPSVDSGQLDAAQQPHCDHVAPPGRPAFDGVTRGVTPRRTPESLRLPRLAKLRPGYRGCNTIARANLWRIRMHIRSATLLTLLPISAFAQATLVARDPVDGLSLAGTTLVWKSDCGGDLATAARVRFMDTRGTSIVTTYFSDACDANRPASTRAVADNDFVYWLTGAGAVVRAPLVPVPGSAPQQIAHTSLSRIAGYPSCCSIAVDDHYVYWTETNAVWRVAKGGGTPIVIARASGTRVTDVQATSGASPRVFYIDVTPGGGRLRALLPASANTYFPLPAGESVVAYALSTDHLVYVSAGDQGAYTVFSRSLPSLASATTLFHDDG